MAVTSIQRGELYLAVMARMYNTSLTNQYSSNIELDAQQMVLTTTVNLETYV